MAVNSITFGGVNSADFGIYISGEGVFNAPKRDVEMIDIPGRNGSFALDNGRFENITVTYPAFNFEPDDYETFMQNLSDFRNAICSQKGYQRLTDSFHPDEYRMAVYKDGLEIKPIKYNTASEFDIVFDCKPQRYLTSGESAISVTSGDTVTNPTLFEAGPLLEVEGVGAIAINGAIIERNDVPIGTVVLFPKTTSNNPVMTIPLDLSQLDNGDNIALSLDTRITYHTKSSSIEYAHITATSNVSHASVTALAKTASYLILCPANFQKGTSSSVTATTAIEIKMKGRNPSAGTITLYMGYDGVNTVYITVSWTAITYINDTAFQTNVLITGDSTKSSDSQPTFIDLDLGEAYIIENDEIVSVNDAVELPATLPTLEPGANTITYDNTITSFSITPRWWKI